MPPAHPNPRQSGQSSTVGRLSVFHQHHPNPRQSAELCSARLAVFHHPHPILPQSAELNNQPAQRRVGRWTYLLKPQLVNEQLSIYRFVQSHTVKLLYWAIAWNAIRFHFRKNYQNEIKIRLYFEWKLWGGGTRSLSLAPPLETWYPIWLQLGLTPNGNMFILLAMRQAKYRIWKTHSPRG